MRGGGGLQGELHAGRVRVHPLLRHPPQPGCAHILRVRPPARAHAAHARTHAHVHRRSLSLDEWTEKQVKVVAARAAAASGGGGGGADTRGAAQTMASVGNKRASAYYEATLPDECVARKCA